MYSQACLGMQQRQKLRLIKKRYTMMIGEAEVNLLWTREPIVHIILL